MSTCNCPSCYKRRGWEAPRVTNPCKCSSCDLKANSWAKCHCGKNAGHGGWIACRNSEFERLNPEVRP